MKVTELHNMQIFDPEQSRMMTGYDFGVPVYYVPSGSVIEDVKTDRALFVCLSGNRAWYHAGGKRERFVTPAIKKNDAHSILIPIVGGNSAKRIVTKYTALPRLICLLRGYDLNRKAVIHKNGDPKNNSEHNLIVIESSELYKYRHTGRTSRFKGVFYRSNDTRRGFYWVSSVGGVVKYFDEEIDAALDAVQRRSESNKRGLDKYLEPFTTEEMHQYNLWRYAL